MRFNPFGLQHVTTSGRCSSYWPTDATRSWIALPPAKDAARTLAVVRGGLDQHPRRGLNCPITRVVSADELDVALDEIIPSLAERTSPLVVEVDVAADPRLEL